MEGSRNHPCTKNFAFYISHTFPCLIILSPIITADFTFSLCFFVPCPGLLHGHLQSLGHPQHFSGHPHLGFTCSYNFLLNNLKAWSFVSESILNLKYDFVFIILIICTVVILKVLKKNLIWYCWKVKAK